MKEDRTIKEKCQQCGELYIPTRKGVQKFCSSSCRSRFWFLKKQKKTTSSKAQQNLDKLFEQKNQELVEVKEQQPNRIEKMSISGVGNAAAGNLVADAVTSIAKNIFQSENSKPATKGDLEILQRQLNKRYSPVMNVNNQLGKKAYYDKELYKIVFYNEQLKKFELPIMDL